MPKRPTHRPGTVNSKTRSNKAMSSSEVPPLKLADFKPVQMFDSTTKTRPVRNVFSVRAGTKYM